VGLGNSGFFFSQVLPMQGRALDEIIRILTELSFLPNPKNLWVRLLSETGMTGFSLFISWLIVLWSTVKFLLSSRNQLERMVGWMGLITILALIGEGFSIDSFALPYYWVSLGILTAASMSARENANRSRKTMHSSKPIDK
jgi:hypothetical protein